MKTISLCIVNNLININQYLTSTILHKLLHDNNFLHLIVHLSQGWDAKMKVSPTFWSKSLAYLRLRNIYTSNLNIYTFAMNLSNPTGIGLRCNCVPPFIMIIKLKIAYCIKSTLSRGVIIPLLEQRRMRDEAAFATKFSILKWERSLVSINQRN